MAFFFNTRPNNHLVIIKKMALMGPTTFKRCVFDFSCNHFPPATPKNMKVKNATQGRKVLQEVNDGAK